MEALGYMKYKELNRRDGTAVSLECRVASSESVTKSASGFAGAPSGEKGLIEADADLPAFLRIGTGATRDPCSGRTNGLNNHVLNVPQNLKLYSKLRLKPNGIANVHIFYRKAGRFASLKFRLQGASRSACTFRDLLNGSFQMAAASNARLPLKSGDRRWIQENDRPRRNTVSGIY
jgi:hypothetical protein